MPDQLNSGQLLLFSAPIPQPVEVVQDLPRSPVEVQTPVVFTDGVLESCLTGAARIVRDVMERQWAERQTRQIVDEVRQAIPGSEVVVVRQLEAPPPQEVDGVLQTLEQLVNGLQNGTDISGLQGELAKYVLNQESRAELVTNLVMTHDYQRLSSYMKARSSLEGIMLQAAVDRRLTPTQALAFLRIIQEESEVILNRVRGGATNVKDLIGLLNRADFALQTKEAELGKKFASTTPQGREIIRRMAHRLKKIYGAASPSAASGVSSNRIED